MGRHLRNIVIVDNAPVSYYLQQTNGIPTKSWYDEKTDRELFWLIPILKNLAGFYDVRTEIPKFVVGNTLIWSKAVKWIEENNLLLNAFMKEDEENNKKKIQSASFNNNDKILTEDQSLKYLNNKSQTIIHCEENDQNDVNEYPVYCQTEVDNDLSPSYKLNQNDYMKKDLINEFSNFNTSQIINKPNINIHIINGNFNNIIMPKKSNKTNLNKSSSFATESIITNNKKHSTENSISQLDFLMKTPTQSIISDLLSFSNKPNIKKEEKIKLFSKTKASFKNFLTSSSKKINNKAVITHNPIVITEKETFDKINDEKNGYIDTQNSEIDNISDKSNINLKPNEIKKKFVTVKTNFSNFIKNNLVAKSSKTTFNNNRTLGSNNIQNNHKLMKIDYTKVDNLKKTLAITIRR